MMRNGDEVLSTYFSHDDYVGLSSFHKKIWLSKAPYKVTVARREFNLNYLFMEEEEAQYNEEYNTNDIISNTALLFCAKEIADYYKALDEFPEILIIDDILIHGRGIKKLIGRFEKLILSFLEVGEGDDLWRKKIHKDIFSALRIHVFAKNTQGIILEDEYPVYTEKLLGDAKLRVLSQQISRTLQQFDVANTSYVLSARLPWNFFKEEFKKEDIAASENLFQYRGNVLKYYFKEKGGLLETIRFYDSNRNRNNKQMATSLTIFESIPEGKENGFYGLCTWLADEILGIISFSCLANYLLLPHKNLIRPKAQLLSFILSVLSYADFYREKINEDPESVYRGLIQSDYLKIAANFDKPKRIQYELLQLFKYISQHKGVKKYVFEKVSEAIGEDVVSSEKSAEGEHFHSGSLDVQKSMKSLHETVENLFYDVGMDAEYEASHYIITDPKVDKVGETLDVDTIRLNQYYSFMDMNCFSKQASLGALFNLLDNGLLAMNLEWVEPLNRVFCVLKAGELSTFSVPRRLITFIPALSMVERAYQNSDNRTIKRVMARFIEYLRNRSSLDGFEEKADREELDRLDQAKASLLYTYDVGKNIRDWDVDLLTAEDWFSYGLDENGYYDGKKQRSSEMDMDLKTRYYKFCARRFLKMKGK